MEMFKIIIKCNKLISDVIFWKILAEQSPIAEGFYEYELHSVANSDVHLVEKMLRKRKNEVYVK